MRCSGADAATEDSDGQASGADAAKAGGSKPAAANDYEIIGPRTNIIDKKRQMI
jgi:hypothetical protein